MLSVSYHEEWVPAIHFPQPMHELNQHEGNHADYDWPDSLSNLFGYNLHSFMSNVEFTLARQRIACNLWLCQLLDDVLRQMVFDFPMARDGLTGAVCHVLIPIMAPAMTDEGAAKILNSRDKVTALHATWSSPTRRGEGISPEVRSW